MNLDKIKRETDFNETNENEIKELKKNAIHKFEDFFKISKESYSLWEEKMRKSVDKFVSDFAKYMVENGFTVDCVNPEITESNYPEINAQYKTKNISLDSLNYEGEKMYFMNDRNCNAEFWFDLPDSAPRYLYWKDNIVVSGKRLTDFGKTTDLSYQAFVDSFNTKEELQEIIKKLQINIEHFEDSIKDIDKYNFCIYKFGEEKKYMNFSEFVDSIEA